MRWQSRGSRVALRRDFTTGGPIVKLGTKCPSMMSTWMTEPPPSAVRPTWSAKWAKSAERIEGASSIKTGNLSLTKEITSEDSSTRGGSGRSSAGPQNLVEAKAWFLGGAALQRCIKCPWEDG